MSLQARSIGYEKSFFIAESNSGEGGVSLAARAKIPFSDADILFALINSS
jgi:hypothetical protein